MLLLIVVVHYWTIVSTLDPNLIRAFLTCKVFLHKVVLLADIEKAFLMVSIAEQDFDVLWFLWVKDIREAKPEILELRFTHVVFGVSSSPFLLNATIYVPSSGELGSELRCDCQAFEGFYDDHLITGAQDEAEAFHLYKTPKEIIKAGEINPRKFVSSSHLVQARIADIEASYEVHQYNLPPGIIEVD